MPDENKFAKLREVGYKIPGLCAFCQCGDFTKTGATWGTCSKHLYEHGKHTGEARGVSIHFLGSCPSFVEDPQKMARQGLGAHEEFLPGRVPQELPPSQGKKQKPR